MTVGEQLAFLGESAAEDLKWARIAAEQEDWALALQNYGQAVSHRFQRALVGWRSGTLDPVPDVEATREVSEAAIEFMSNADVGPLRALFDPVPGAYGSLLIDRLDSRAVAETGRLAVRPVPRGLTVDRTLDGWLVSAILGRDPGAGPDVATGLGRGKRTVLVSETYSTYFALAALSGDEVAVATTLTQRGLELFARRRRDGYYSGGVPYEGGGPDNSVVVDFRLAAIWHARGWDPSGLAAEERVHVQLPSMG